MSVKISVDLVAVAQKSEEFRQKPRQVIERSVARYMRFLQLLQKFPDHAFAPSRDIDEIWHLHMLCPRAYYEDCITLFGDILDHDGGFGSVEVERDALLQIFNDTAKMWREEFGEEYVSVNDSLSQMKDCIKACRKACKKAPMAVA